MPVVGGCQQCSPSILRKLVYIGARSEQELGRFQIPFASRKNQRGQSATARADKTGYDDVLVVHVVNWQLGSRARLASALAGSRVPASCRRRRRTRRLVKATPACMESTFRLFELQLLLVSSTGSSSLGIPPHRRVDLRGVHALGHVISG